MGIKSTAKSPNTVDAQRGVRALNILLAKSCGEKKFLSYVLRLYLSKALAYRERGSEDTTEGGGQNRCIHKSTERVPTSGRRSLLLEQTQQRIGTHR